MKDDDSGHNSFFLVRIIHWEPHPGLNFLFAVIDDHELRWANVISVKSFLQTLYFWSAKITWIFGAKIHISLACNDLKKDYGLLVRHIWVFNDIGAWPKCQKGPVTLVIVRTSWHFHLKLHHKVHFPKKLHLAVNNDNLKDSVTICIFISFSKNFFSSKDNKSNCFLIGLAITTYLKKTLLLCFALHLNFL